jgi:hypothetical protein
MPEEYDPLQKLGSGNAYDDLVAGRTSKLKKRAAAGGGAGVGVIVAIIVVRAIFSGASSSRDNRPEPRFNLNHNFPITMPAGQPNLHPDGPGALSLELERKVLRLQIEMLKKERSQNAAEDAVTTAIRLERLKNLEAQLKALEAAEGKPGVINPQGPEDPGDPEFVGPPLPPRNEKR